MLKLVTNGVVWITIVSQWGSYGSQRTSVLKTFLWSFSIWGHGEINVGQWGIYGPNRVPILIFFCQVSLQWVQQSHNCWPERYLRTPKGISSENFLSGCLSYYYYFNKAVTDLIGHFLPISVTDHQLMLFSCRLYYFYITNLYKLIWLPYTLAIDILKKYWSV